MTFADVVRARLAVLGYEQRDLARAVDVTDSYVSQLLTRRKAPPSTERTDIYPRMESFLELEAGELARLVEIERTEEARRKLARPPEPLFRKFRDLVLKKCAAAKQNDVRAVFEERPFGTLERLVTRTLLEAVQGIARKELERKNWSRLADCVGAQSHEQMRVIVLDFLDTDVFDVSKKNCVAFLDPLVESWDIDMDTLRLDVWFNTDLVDEARLSYSFRECAPAGTADPEPGFEQFLADSRLSGQATEDEARFLGSQRFQERRPTKLYYYRALQNLRDPLHFTESGSAEKK